MSTEESDMSDAEQATGSDDAGELSRKYSLKSLPEKSKELYQSTYRKFIEWRDANNLESFSEDMMIQYFTELSDKVKPPTLWAQYSMLKHTISGHNDVDISNFKKLRKFLRRKNSGYKSQKTKVFTSKEVERFLNEAADSQYLAVKVALIFGILGACKNAELVQMKTDDIEDDGIMAQVTIPKTDIEPERSFTVCDEFYQIYKKYALLRPNNTDYSRFFLNYRGGKCFKKAIGHCNFNVMPKTVATYLKLPKPDDYRSNSFRCTSALLLAHSGADIKDYEPPEKSVIVDFEVQRNIADPSEIIMQSSSALNQTLHNKEELRRERQRRYRERNREIIRLRNRIHYSQTRKITQSGACGSGLNDTTLREESRKKLRSERNRRYRERNREALKSYDADYRQRQIKGRNDETIQRHGGWNSKIAKNVIAETKRKQIQLAEQITDSVCLKPSTSSSGYDPLFIDCNPNPKDDNPLSEAEMEPILPTFRKEITSAHVMEPPKPPGKVIHTPTASPVLTKTVPVPVQQQVLVPVSNLEGVKVIQRIPLQVNPVLPQASPEIRLRWGHYHSNMETCFPSLLDSEDFVDVTLACEGRSLKCHKLILSSCSEYLAQLLRENVCPHPIIIMQDMKFWQVEALVKFMYKGEVSVPHDKLVQLLKAANTLQIKGLINSNGPQTVTPAPQIAKSSPLTSPPPNAGVAPQLSKRECPKTSGNSSSSVQTTPKRGAKRPTELTEPSQIVRKVSRKRTETPAPLHSPSPEIKLEIEDTSPADLKILQPDHSDRSPSNFENSMERSEDVHGSENMETGMAVFLKQEIEEDEEEYTENNALETDDDDTDDDWTPEDGT